MGTTKIEWTDVTWNPVRGCTRVSPGCEHCYAERLVHRFNRPGMFGQGLTVLRQGAPGWSGKVDLVERELERPLHWRRPRRVFVCSISDLFHGSVPFDFIDQVFAAMRAAPQHTYQILTKRPRQMRSYLAYARHDYAMPWIWLGVSAEDQQRLDERLPVLVDASLPGARRFLSCEPLLGPLSVLDLRGVDWVIVGGESGPGARPMDPEWARGVRDACLEQGVAFHFKQWGGAQKGKAGRLLDGRTWDEGPEAAR